MRELRLVIGLLAVLSSVATGVAQTITTQTSSNTTSSSSILRGVANAQGSNTLTWFEFGTTTDLGTTLSNLNVGAGTTNVNTRAAVTDLLEGTRYYFRAAGSNAVNGIVRGTIENFVTTSVSYEFGGLAFTNLDITRPQGNESGFVWDEALRQTKEWMVGYLEIEHADYGLHKNGFLQTDYIANNAVTWAKLSADVQDNVTNAWTNAVATVFVTNALKYAASIEAGSNAVRTTTTEKTLATSEIASNTFSSVIVDFNVYLDNSTSSGHTWNYIKVQVAGVDQQPSYGPYRLPANQQSQIPGSVRLSGGQATNTGVSVVAQSDNAAENANIKATLKYLRIYGVP